MKPQVKIFSVLLLVLAFLTNSYGDQNDGSVAAIFPKLHSREKRDSLRGRSSGLLPQALHKHLSRAHGYLAKGEYAQSVQLLKELLSKYGERPSELSQIEQTLAFALAQKGEGPQAIRYAKKALDQESLPEAATLSLLYLLSQLYLSTGQNGLASQTLLEWFGYVENPSPQAYILRAMLLAEEGKKRDALFHVEKAISLSDHPEENWLQFAAALHIEEKRYAKAVPYLKQLTAQHPEKSQYWKQFSSLHSDLELQNQALAINEMANKWGHVTEESEILALASLYLNAGIPHEAAKLIERSMASQKVAASEKSWSLLSQSWLDAEEFEKATVALHRAAELSSSGRLYAQLGQIYLDQNEWTKAIQALEKALKRGGLKEKGRAELALGIAHFYLNQNKKALDYFQVAERELGKDSEQARQWTKYVGAVR